MLPQATGHSENSERDASPSTKLEAFTSEKGRLFVKEVHEIGGISGQFDSTCSLEAVVIYSPGRESQMISGLKLGTNEQSDYEKSDTGFLDREEIESLTAALDYMGNVAKEWASQPREYTEVHFETKGEVTVGFFQKNLEQWAYVKCGGEAGATCFLKSVADLSRVKSLLNNGAQQLDQVCSSA